jgi:3-hydroxyacyl-CoA dehydrogenase
VTQSVVILGSGMMALSAGRYLLGRGCRVTWVSQSAERLEALEKRVRRFLGRLPGADRAQGLAAFAERHGALPSRVDVIFETTVESLEEKRRAWDSVASKVPGDPPRLTNSSSILPSAMDGLTAGLHLFHPVELTGFAEVIMPDDASDSQRSLVLSLADRWGLTCLVQSERNAFALNRLLLPLQAEVLRALASGVPAGLVDPCSCMDLLPRGQLAMMDSVGLDVVHAAAANYVSRMPEGAAAGYAPLLDGLAALLALGKRGRKNNDGFLAGTPLPWKPADPARDLEQELTKTFESLFLNTCLRFLERELIDEASLESALRAVFQSGCSLSEAVARTGAGNLRRALEGRHGETGLDYFRPARSLEPGALHEAGKEAAGP